MKLAPEAKAFNIYRKERANAIIKFLSGHPEIKKYWIESKILDPLGSLLDGVKNYFTENR